jgi:zinc transport system ATP-binding protein
MSLISFKNVKLRYKNKLVVDNLTIDIQKGDFLCVLGSNGSGKTTFVRSLVGLTPLLEGSIEFADSFDKKAIGYLPQQTSVQSDFPASAYEVVISGCLNKCGLFPFIPRSKRNTPMKL